MDHREIMRDVEICPGYQLRVLSESSELLLAEIWRVTRTDTRTTSESIGHLVGHKDPGDYEHYPHWDVQLFLTSKRRVGGIDGGVAVLKTIQGPEFPDTLPEQVRDLLLNASLCTQPMLLWFNDYSIVRDIQVGDIADND